MQKPVFSRCGSYNILFSVLKFAKLECNNVLQSNPRTHDHTGAWQTLVQEKEWFILLLQFKLKVKCFVNVEVNTHCLEVNELVDHRQQPEMFTNIITCMANFLKI